LYFFFDCISLSLMYCL